MFRIGLIGSENSHATAFGKLINGFDQHSGEFSDMRAVAAFSIYPEANIALKEACGVEEICEKPEDMLGKVDAVMITARDGKYHAPYARPFIEAGIPCFIDKPFTSSSEKAVELIRLAKANKVPLVGGSLLKIADGTVKMAEAFEENKASVIGGDVTAPVSLKNDYGDFWFYSAHLAETVLRVFGKPEWIWANQTPNGVTCVAHYPDFDVTNHYTEGTYVYRGTLNLKGAAPLDFPIGLDDGYLYEMRSFAAMLREGKMEFSYEELAAPVFYIEAILESLRTGEKAEVKEIKLD